MADIFVSYARADRDRVAPLVKAIEAQGWSVWWDPAITPGQEFDRQIAAELDAARAVIVVWTPTSVESRWVRGEARDAADRGILVPVRFEATRLPIDARALHTVDLDDWREDVSSPAFQELVRAASGVLGPASAPGGSPAQAPARKGVSICVLPFANISGEPEQEYFSDGISEDIITDLSKVSALSVVSRNTAFTFKGSHVDVGQVGRQLKVTHVLEGSVRKAGQRVRITAQLIDAAADSHVWAERYDRDLDDIFALQDEIARAIVAALKLRLLPEESQELGRRGTPNVDAYNLYLMARHFQNRTGARQHLVIVRLCRRALEFCPDYARAWALLGSTLSMMRLFGTGPGEGAAEAVARALELNPNLAEAHAARGRMLLDDGLYDEAEAEIAEALRLEPDSYEANAVAGRWAIGSRRFAEAVRFLETAARVSPTDYWALGMALQAHRDLGDEAGAKDAARRALERIEPLVAAEPDLGGAVAFGVTALVTLGEVDRALEWAELGLVLDPDNLNMRYNLACQMATLGQADRAFELLEPMAATITEPALDWMKRDSDLDPIRDDPRYAGFVQSAEARLQRRAIAVGKTGTASN